MKGKYKLTARGRAVVMFLEALGCLAIVYGMCLLMWLIWGEV